MVVSSAILCGCGSTTRARVALLHNVLYGYMHLYAAIQIAMPKRDSNGRWTPGDRRGLHYWLCCSNGTHGSLFIAVPARGNRARLTRCRSPKIGCHTCPKNLLAPWNSTGIDPHWPTCFSLVMCLQLKGLYFVSDLSYINLTLNLT
jgi:hypothetical protein